MKATKATRAAATSRLLPDAAFLPSGKRVPPRSEGPVGDIASEPHNSYQKEHEGKREECPGDGERAQAPPALSLICEDNRRVLILRGLRCRRLPVIVQTRSHVQPRARQKARRDRGSRRRRAVGRPGQDRHLPANGKHAKRKR